MIALGIGILTVSSTVILASVYLGSLVDTDDIFFLVMQVLWVSIPFLVLALKPVDSVMAWIVGLIATLALWAAYFYTAFISHRDHSGVDFGMVFALLLSPFLILALSLLAARLERGAVAHGSEGAGH
jgi:peptidoglycan/LPS O-acetylase OafA/YrhL